MTGEAGEEGMVRIEIVVFLSRKRVRGGLQEGPRPENKSRHRKWDRERQEVGRS